MILPDGTNNVTAAVNNKLTRSIADDVSICAQRTHATRCAGLNRLCLNRFSSRSLFPQAGPLSRALRFAPTLDRVAGGNTIAREKRFRLSAGPAASGMDDYTAKPFAWRLPSTRAGVGALSTSALAAIARRGRGKSCDTNTSSCSHCASKVTMTFARQASTRRCSVRSWPSGNCPA
jgi:hypothetical protein